MSQEKTQEQVVTDNDELETTDTGEETSDVATDDSDADASEEAGTGSDDDEKAWLKENGLDGYTSLKDAIEAAKAHKQSNANGNDVQIRLLQQQIDTMKSQPGRTGQDDKGDKPLFPAAIMKDLVEARISSGHITQENSAFWRGNASLMDEGLGRVTQTVEKYLLNLMPVLQRANEAADRAEYGSLPKTFRDRASQKELQDVMKSGRATGYWDALSIALLEKNDFEGLAKLRGVKLDVPSKPGMKTRTALPKVKTQTKSTSDDGYSHYLNKDGTVNNEKLFKEKSPEKALEIVNKIGQAAAKKGSVL